MKRRLLTMLILSGMLAFSLQSFLVTPASAKHNSIKKPAPVPAVTEMVLSGPGIVVLGKPFVLEGALRDQFGNKIAHKSITFTANGGYLGQAPTSPDGVFKLTVHKDLPAGQYQITAHFDGAHLLDPSSGSTQVEVLPSILRVQTIPALSGVVFEIDGRQFVSGENGLATIEMYKTGLYRLKVLISNYKNPHKRIVFGRWEQESYEPSRSVRIPSNEVVQVGLNVFHEINQTFVDVNGHPIDPGRITGIMIKSAQGDVFSLKEGQTVWVPASRTARRQTSLEETKLLYSVISVTIDGSSVVNQAQQRFYANANDDWIISLLLYSMHVNVKDALFGTPIGESLRVAYPDGQIKDYKLDGLKSADIYSLARGIYHIEVIGINGLRTVLPVALSRDQTVNVTVVTYVDMAVVGSIGLLTAIGLVLFGRPWLIRNLLPKKSRTALQIGQVTFHEN
jgi:hypothetical protein